MAPLILLFRRNLSKKVGIMRSHNHTAQTCVRRKNVANNTFRYTFGLVHNAFRYKLSKKCRQKLTMVSFTWHSVHHYLLQRFTTNIETKYVFQLIETILTLHSLPHNRSSRSRFALVRLPADTRQAPQLRRCQLSYYVDDEISDKGNNTSLSNQHHPQY